jgi:PBSX family phage terminase large subunit
MELNVPAQPKQYEFLRLLFNERKRFVGYIGGRRGGKTFIGARAAALKVLECEQPGEGWIISPTYPMSEVPISEFEKTGIMEFCTSKNKNDRTYEFQTPKGKFIVRVKTAEDPDKLRGAGLAWIWIDEAAYISKEAWDILLACVLDHKGTIFITTTPKRNWLYDEFYLESLKDPDYALVTSRSDENIILDKHELEKLRGKYSTDYARQELDAEFVSFEGLVYKDFDPRLHIIDPVPIPANAKIWGGLDYGFDDPFVHLWFAFWDGHYYLIDEHYESGKPYSDHAHQIKMRQFDKNIISRFGDPSNPQAACELARYGIYVVPGKRDIVTGIQRVSKLLKIRMDGRPGLQVFSTCPKTIQEFSKYCYPDSGNREIPKDSNNHTMDAMKYCLSSVYVDEDPVQYRISQIPDNISPAERRIIEQTMSIPESRRTLVRPRKRSVLDSYDYE